MFTLIREINGTDLEMIIEVLGILAGCCTCGASIPQLINILKTKSTVGVSLGASIMLFLGNLLWLAYGIIILSPAMIIMNSFGSLLFAIVLVIKIHNMLTKKE